jgi:hypothetical protein
MVNGFAKIFFASKTLFPGRTKVPLDSPFPFGIMMPMPYSTNDTPSPFVRHNFTAECCERADGTRWISIYNKEMRVSEPRKACIYDPFIAAKLAIWLVRASEWVAVKTNAGNKGKKKKKKRHVHVTVSNPKPPKQRARATMETQPCPPESLDPTLSSPT